LQKKKNKIARFGNTRRRALALARYKGEESHDASLSVVK